jgi:hypothetical protein
MVDKIKPLKLEDPSKGTELDLYPTETDPAEDYLAAKGLSIECEDTTLIDKAADGSIQFTDANSGVKKVAQLHDADEEDFDPTGTDLTSTKTGPAIRELRGLITSSASPGFSWGRSGNISNAWLLNEGVSSNKAGRAITFDDPELVRIFTATEDLNTYTLTIYEHEGDEINLTSLTTLSVTAARTGDSGAITVAATAGRQLAIKLTSGSAKNIVVGIQLSGSNA